MIIPTCGNLMLEIKRKKEIKSSPTRINDVTLDSNHTKL